MQVEVKKKQGSKGFMYWFDLLFNPLILLAYGYVTVLTPRMNAFDSAGTKFLALAILNLFVFAYLLLRKEKYPPQKIFSYFFINRVGFLYGAFLFLNLFSFCKAVNPAESLLAFTKFFSVFSAILMIATIIHSNPKQIEPLVFGMSVLLLIDASMVFHQMWQQVDQYPNFADLYQSFRNTVTSGYSNVNILSSALFLKLPFALWILAFRKGLVRLFGLITILSGVVAIIVVSSRAFYVGLALLAIAYLLFLIIRLFVDRQRLKTAIISLVAIALIPLFFYLGWLGLSHYIPTLKSFNLKDRIVARLSTIQTDESSGIRIISWKQSLALVKEDPLFGVGVGNWKINVLKYENRIAPDYTYYYYNHNDFIQTTAETGILGGLLFIALFIGIGWAFLFALIKGAVSGNSYKYLFVPSFGMLCYSVDAFFNFPFDRPEIQSLFAIFMGVGVACSPQLKMLAKLRTNKFVTRHASRVTCSSYIRYRTQATAYTLPFLFILLAFSSIYLLYLNFRSLQLQGAVKYEIEKGELTLPASIFMLGFPSIPTISVEGVPIAILKTRYLFNEGQYDVAIDLLKRNNPSPWESRREYFLSLAYEMKKNSDSSLAYGMQVFKLKPMFTDNVERICTILDEREKFEEASKILDDYLKGWNEIKSKGLYHYSEININSEQKFINWRKELKLKATIQRVEFLYYSATEQYKQRNYREAAGYFTTIIEKEPELYEAWEKRAWCYFYLNEQTKSLADIDHLTAKGIDNQGLKELRTKVIN